MKYVYLLMTGCDGDEGVYEIFSSKKKADAKLKELLNDPYWRTTDPYIEKWEVK